LVALGERVRGLRSRRGMTRKAVSVAAHVSERHLANLEYGEGNASILVLLQVAGALQCSLAELIGDVTLIQFVAAQRTGLVPEARSFADLFRALADLGYRRLSMATNDTNDCRRADVLVKAMAHSLVRVEFHSINWRPLLATAKFTHAKKFGS
jgi:XRE family aerobic/anaerobic benzoate catabolism transcriptional regulator